MECIEYESKQQDSEHHLESTKRESELSRSNLRTINNVRFCALVLVAACTMTLSRVIDIQEESVVSSPQHCGCCKGLDLPYKINKLCKCLNRSHRELIFSSDMFDLYDTQLMMTLPSPKTIPTMMYTDLTMPDSQYAIHHWHV